MSTPGFDPEAAVAEFHTALGRSRGDGLDITGDLRRRDAGDRAELHSGEGEELLTALVSGDRAAIAHELADVVYVALGTAYSLDLPLMEALAAVHAANMAKAGPDGRISADEHGKAVKPEGHVPPDIAGVVFRHDRRRAAAAAPGGEAPCSECGLPGWDCLYGVNSHGGRCCGHCGLSPVHDPEFLGNRGASGVGWHGVGERSGAAG